MDEFRTLLYFAITIFVIMIAIYPLIAYFSSMKEEEFLVMELIMGILFFTAIFMVVNINNNAVEELLKKEKLSIATSGTISDSAKVKTFNHRGVIIHYVIRDSVIIIK